MTETPESAAPTETPCRVRNIHLIGVGSSGGAIADALLRSKAIRDAGAAVVIHVWDDDRVEADNIEVQRPYGLCDVRTEKVYALRSYAERQQFPTTMVAHAERVTAETTLDGIVVMGVDSMESRGDILTAVIAGVEKVELCIDTRTGGKHWQIFAFSPVDVDATNEYRRRLHPDSASLPLPCGEKTRRTVPSVLADRVRIIVERYLEKGVIKKFYLSNDSPK